MNSSRMADLTSLKPLLSALARLRRSGKKIVFTNGCFDVLHLGHVRYLDKAKSLGDVLVVGLNSDASVRKLKGPGRPVNGIQDRAGVVKALKAVDYVTVFKEETPLNLIRALGPDILVKGGDWKPKDIVGSDFVLSHGGKVLSLPFVKSRSTTKVLGAIHRL